MSAKILVADDSLTIQKVISITLSSTGHELLTANSYQELIEKLKGGEINLVLLDFNLSENIDGYSLAKKIKELSPSSEIIMMYGTFDNVDDGQLSDSDVRDKVIKPFESNLFIQKCNEVLGESNISSIESATDNAVLEGDLTQESANLSNMESIFSSDDNWVMSAPSMEDDETESLEVIQQPVSEEDSNLVLMESAMNNKNVLKNEIEDWGMSVPGKIDGDEERVSMPPEIAASDESSVDEVVIDQSQEETAEHVIEDIIEDNTEDTDDVITLSSDFTDKPELQSIDEFALEDEGITEMPITVESGDEEPAAVVEEKVEELAKDIEEEISADNFWAADEDDSGQSDPDATLEIIPANLQQAHHEKIIDDLEEEPVEIVQEFNPIQQTINEQDVVEALFEKVKPLLDEKIEEYIKKHLDNSAWDIIPDLAENVIKEEVRRISDSVLDSSSFEE
jgi:CheY-like chemotaxis protein